MYQFDALTLLCGYFADAGSLSKLLFAHCSVSAPDLTSMLLPLLVPIPFLSLLQLLLLLPPCFLLPSFPLSSSAVSPLLLLGFPVVSLLFRSFFFFFFY